jgi:hypothetical protein
LASSLTATGKSLFFYILRIGYFTLERLSPIQQKQTVLRKALRSSSQTKCYNENEDDNDRNKVNNLITRTAASLDNSRILGEPAALFLSNARPRLK